MSARDDATEAQVRAADPAVSTWLAANAGSGKTRVLTDRVARLLLRGVDPAHVLCLTYTKAAASEMQNRLFQTLGRWAMLHDDALRVRLAEVGEEREIDLARARTLFAGAIETPGGLKIQTIHSFCASLLRRFPLEAGVSPQFQEMEERAAELLRDQIIEEMAAGSDAPLFEEFARFHSGHELSRLLAEIVQRQEAFGAGATRAEIAAACGIPADFSRADIEAQLFDGTEAAMFARLLPLLAKGSSAPDREIGQRLATLGPLTLEALPTLRAALLTQNDTPRKNNPVKAIREAVPEIVPFAERVAAAVEAEKALHAVEATEALHRFAAAFLDRYRNAKQSRGWLDFDDLILKTRRLLTESRVADWVLYRLDGGLSHILVDEAQDTSPAQWEVIRALASEFTSGKGAQDGVRRTIFVVGDKKQSIYSFQGADPGAFDRMEADFRDRSQAVDAPFFSLRLEYSFRSSDAILRLVDHIFDTEIVPGVPVGQTHRAFHGEKPGRVDLWPVIEPASAPEDREWTDTLDHTPDTHHTMQLARAVAAQIRDMLDPENPALIPERRGETHVLRPVRAGDIMVLLQRRSDMFHEIIRACKRLDLPIAGADRLRVGGELAVRDLLALLSFLATPEDSLSLAVMLRSPLGGWSEAELFGLANGRGARHLWQVLRERRDAHPETVDMLLDLRRQIDFLRPYELLERILTRYGGRAKLLARLGSEAQDGIDAILSQALAYERGSVPSLTGFLRWAQADDLEIKRQTDSAGDLIRVMTVHGAKGLESPIVILPDCGKRQVRIRDQLLSGDGPPVWNSPAAETPAAIETRRTARKQSEMEERMRLLYVALTRAESWLIVAAAGELSKDRTDWYQLVETGIRAVGGRTHGFSEGPGMRYEFGAWDRAEVAAVEPGVDTTAPSLEPFFYQPATTPAPILDPLRASDLGGAKALASSEGLPERIATARGTYAHELLEALAPLPRQERPAAMAAIPPPDGVTQPLIDSVRQDVIACFAATNLDWIFAEDALAEVELTVPWDSRSLIGVIDRLILKPGRVTAVDFKTNAAVPKTHDDCPEGLLRQMGAYAAALARIYPDRVIETGLLWTAEQRYMPLPSDRVAAALARSPHLDAPPGAT